MRVDAALLCLLHGCLLHVSGRLTSPLSFPLHVICCMLSSFVRLLCVVCCMLSVCCIVPMVPSARCLLQVAACSPCPFAFAALCALEWDGAVHVAPYHAWETAAYSQHVVRIAMREYVLPGVLRPIGCGCGVAAAAAIGLVALRTLHRARPRRSAGARQMLQMRAAACCLQAAWARRMAEMEQQLDALRQAEQQARQQAAASAREAAAATELAAASAREAAASAREAAAAKEQAAASNKALRDSECIVERLRRASSVLSPLRSPLSIAAVPLARFALHAEEQGGFKTASLAPDTVEYAMLRELWEAGGPGGRPNRFPLKRIEVVETERQGITFSNKVEDFEIRRMGAGPFTVEFSPDPPAANQPTVVHDPNGEKRAVIERLKRRFARLAGLQRANALLVFHGCTHDAAHNICRTGFASISTTDAGYFGRGIYATTYAQYAAEYANGALTGKAMPNANGEFVILVAWATPGLAYPITRDHAGADCDYIPGDVSSRFYSNRGEPAKALRSPFDSHYVCIRRDDQQCIDGMRHDVEPEYDELVLGDASQLLPCYRLYF